MDKQLQDRLTRKISIKVFDGAAFNGDPRYLPEPVTLKVYRHGMITRVTSFQGEEFISNEQFICDGLYKFHEGDVITGNRDKPIRAVAVFDGLRPGTGTTIIYL